MRPTILVAEDDPELRYLICNQLRSMGYIVTEARNGRELLSELSETLLFSAKHPPPALVITDVRMPGLSGFDVVNNLRQLRCPTRVVFMTGFGDEDAERAARSLGAVALFSKPFDLDSLCALVCKEVPLC